MGSQLGEGFDKFVVSHPGQVFKGITVKSITKDTLSSIKKDSISGVF